MSVKAVPILLQKYFSSIYHYQEIARYGGTYMMNNSLHSEEELPEQDDGDIGDSVSFHLGPTRRKLLYFPTGTIPTATSL